MSYDLQIWSVFPISLPEGLPQDVAWTQENGHWFYSSSSWHVAIGPSDRVLPEDVPEEVAPLLPGVEYLSELHLSPIDASDAGRRLLKRVAKALARLAHGVVLDPQEDAIITPTGVKRFESLPSSPSASLLSMSWWSISPISREGVSALLDVLEQVLPEALPRRYGLYEPPQHRYSETGRGHFEDFLFENLSKGVVWYPHPPIADFYLKVPPSIGWTRLGFRTVHMSLDVDVDLLTQPGWQTALQRAWSALSKAILPFYGDVRTLRGYTRARGRYWSTYQTEGHPVKAWWWRGIPRGPVHAIVLGQPYRNAWDTSAQHGPTDQDLLHLSTRNWRSREDLYTKISVPTDLVQPPNEGRYPSLWPFAPREPGV